MTRKRKAKSQLSLSFITRKSVKVKTSQHFPRFFCFQKFVYEKSGMITSNDNARNQSHPRLSKHITTTMATFKSIITISRLGSHLKTLVFSFPTTLFHLPQIITSHAAVPKGPFTTTTTGMSLSSLEIFVVSFLIYKMFCLTFSPDIFLSFH